MGLSRNISHLLAALFNNRAEFHRRWNQAAQSGTGGGLEGRWQGEWISDANGHCGALKCLLTQTASGEYRAMFHAVFGGFLTVAYTVPLHGERAGEKLKLAGEADLGKFAGGIYHYEGEADESAFNCTYRCAYDHGTFRLARLR